MGGRVRRWLVPDTPRRKAWQALAYLLITVVALTAAGIRYATASYPAHAPSVIATTPGGARGQGTKGPAGVPAGRNITPARTYPATAAVSPSHRASPRPSATVAPAGVTPSASATTSPAPVTSSPVPSSPQPSASPPLPSEASSAPATPVPEGTTATPPPGGLRLTA